MKTSAHLLTQESSRVRSQFLLRFLLVSLLWLLAVSFAFANITPTFAQTSDDGPAVNAQSAIVVDATTGGILWGKNIHRQAAQASTTKVMTALSALSIPTTSLTEIYTVKKADLVGEASMGLKENEQISFENLLYGMFLNSGNDAATAIADYAGSKLSGSGDPITRFVTYMNQYAPTLGLRNSHYANPHGLDQDGHYSSAFDLAITGWYALKNPTLSKIMLTQTATINGHSLSNLNPILKIYQGANGVKPGFTDNAGLCLIGSATRNGQTVISVIMGDDNAGYHADPQKLLDYGFARLQLPDVQQTLQQGATAATASDYLGRPDGNKLIPVGQPVLPAPSNANTVSIINIGPDGSVIEAQVSQDVTNTITGPSSSNTDTSSQTQKSGGGFNLFSFLLLILILVGIVYCVLRFTSVGGDRGRNIAYQMEDYAGRGWELTKVGAAKLWNFVRPGNQEDDVITPRGGRTGSSIPPTLSDSGYEPNTRRPATVIERPRYDRPTSSSRNSFEAEEADFQEVHESDPPRPASNNRPTISTVTTGTTSSSRRPQKNPLENFFDDVDPFDFNDTTSSTPQPPLPLSNPPVERPIERPVTRSTERITETPKERPASRPTPPAPAPATESRPTERPFGRPAAGSTPVQPPAPLGTSGSLTNPLAANNAEPASPAKDSFASRLTPTPPPDPLTARARQAIDYAYAGRITASTEEFRRVVEQEPMFDFGSIEEFEQMPVLGFRALANAYREAHRLKFAVLLLDMAIEHYPNDLELRNLQRTLRREAGL